MNFSQRKGLSMPPTRLRPDQMPPDLRASLWNALHLSLWDTDGFLFDRGNYGAIIKFARELWFHHFKLPFSNIPTGPYNILKFLEQHFLNCRWNEVYDFIEAVISIRKSDRISNVVNGVLERELAAYRLISGKIAKITDMEEIAALDEALRSADRFAPVSAHFGRALELLSDRTTPDYRNSIKESISAVEAAARILTDKDTATLGDALKLLERDHDLHRALKDGFSKLYGYTSDEHGIRHAMLEEPSLGAAEAKFFLLSCTSFANYLRTRASAA